MTSPKYKFTIQETNITKPEFTDFNYEDTNPATLAITGNKSVIIQNHSQIRVSINNNQKMKTKKYASPVGYLFSVGAKNVSVPNSDNIQYDMGSIDDAEGKRIYATAVDSRYFTVQCFKDIPILPYHKPSLFIKTKRKNDFENETKIEINGEMSSLMVNSERKNKILSLKMRYKEINDVFSDYINLEPVMNEYRYSINPYFLDLDREKQYLIEVTVTDKLSTTVQNVVVVRGIAIFFISTDRETCYIKDKEVVVRDDNNIANINGLYNKDGSTLTFNTNNISTDDDWVLGLSNGKVVRRNISRDLNGRGTFGMNNDNRHLDFNNTNRRVHLLTAESMAWWDGSYSPAGYSNLMYSIYGKILGRARTCLYVGNGTNAKSIQLSASMVNAKKMTFYYRDSDWKYGSTSIINPNNKLVTLDMLSSSDSRNTMKMSSTTYKIVNDRLELTESSVAYMNGSNNYWKVNEIYIYQIDYWNDNEYSR